MPYDGVALWHLDRPAALERAIGAAHRIAPNLSSLADWLLPHLPKRTIASHNIRCTGTEHYSEDASLGYAITLPWFATDNETYSECYKHRCRPRSASRALRIPKAAVSAFRCR